MSAAVLTRWPVVLEVPVAAGDLRPDGCLNDDALGRWFGLVSEAYVQRCPKLRHELGPGRTGLSPGALRVNSRGVARVGDLVRVAIATTELWPSAFEIALRVRVVGSDAGPVANGRCRLGYVSMADGSAVTIPDEVRRELIELESTAFEYC